MLMERLQKNQLLPDKARLWSRASGGGSVMAAAVAAQALTCGTCSCCWRTRNPRPLPAGADEHSARVGAAG